MAVDAQEEAATKIAAVRQGQKARARADKEKSHKRGVWAAIKKNDSGMLRSVSCALSC